MYNWYFCRSILFYYIFLLFYLNLSVLSLETCSSDSNNSNQKCKTIKSNQYTREVNENYNIFLAIIEAAKKDYNPCEDNICKCYTSIIKNDLDAFHSTKITEKMLKEIRSKGTKYQIINNKLYREKQCMFPARCSGVEHFLSEILLKLNNTEFILNTRDWPQIYRNHGPRGPVFSFSKTDDYLDVMYPTWAFWEGGPAITLYPRGIGRWDTHREKLGKIGNDTEWDQKISKAFFRGSRTSSERDALVLLSRKNPDLVDAKYTKNQAWKSEADTLYETPAKEVSFEDHCKYKYLFNFRGVAASFRFKHILLCKSLVFHVGNEWLEFFYPFLKPWIHYVPIKKDATQEEMKEIIKFFDSHQDLAREIAENGYNFIWNNLQLKHVKCYWINLLKKYTKLLAYKPQLDEEMIRV